MQAIESRSKCSVSSHPLAERGLDGSSSQAPFLREERMMFKVLVSVAVLSFGLITVPVEVVTQGPPQARDILASALDRPGTEVPAPRGVQAGSLQDPGRFLSNRATAATYTAERGAPVTGELRSEPARQGQITGTALRADSGDPLSAVQVSVQGTGLGAVTGPDGSFSISQVPAGTYTVVGQRLGFQQVRVEDVTVTSGQTTTIQLSMAQAFLELQGVVATGLIDPVEGVRSPITVGRLTREQMPVVAAGSAIQNLQGRIPGLAMSRQSGAPGSDMTVMLRTPTSVTQTGDPLLVVDGVILGSNSTNIESLDIESIEVIKGAAAASLYGSRAAAGVINITTARGQGLDLGQTRFTVRSEMGTSGVLREIAFPQHHAFLMDDARTTYVDLNGNPVERAGRRLPANLNLAFMDKPYPGPIYDNVSAMLGQPGSFSSHGLTVSQNTASTNFALSANRRDEQGVLRNNDGYNLTSFRINIDHRFLDNLSLGASAYHSRDWLDNVSASFVQLLRAPPDVDMTARDETGQFVRIPDTAFPFENPIWTQGSRENVRTRSRTLGSMALRADPTPWLSLVATGSYDRQESTTRAYIPKGTPTGVGAAESTGSISYNNEISDTWNADVQASLRWTFGDHLNARTTVRGALEMDQTQSALASGSNFQVVGVPRINAAQNRNSTSSEEEIRALGVLWDTALDYDGRYIATVLLRRDGSSLFGPENRWHVYYRTAFKWRLSEEAWFDLPNVNEFGLSYARGTAGGRPSFNHQYETWQVGATGVSRGTLGNARLRPEHTTEQEVSLEMILFERFGVELVHAWQTTTDQLVNAPVPSFLGYNSQWQNGGTVAGHTTELSLEARVLSTPRAVWTTNLIADRSRAKITEWPFPCAPQSYGLRCEGAGMYEVWNFRMLTDHADLIGHHAGGALHAADEFQINDDGHLVWVGLGSHYTDQLWGTSTNIGGRTYDWGIPIVDRDGDGAQVRQRTDDASHVNLGWINAVQFGSVSVHAHLHALLGGVAVNRTNHELMNVNRYPGMDQAGKPDELKKPIAYYHVIFSQGNGTSYHEENQSYLKLRSLGITYRVGSSALGRVGLQGLGMESMTLGFVGRNLFTVTAYSGFDPEQSLGFGNRITMDRFQYPNTRNFTFEVQAVF